MADQRAVYEAKLIELNSLMERCNLSDEQKSALRLGLELGYAAAFCERTCDMNGSYFVAQSYQNGYKEVLEKLK